MSPDLRNAPWGRIVAVAVMVGLLAGTGAAAARSGPDPESWTLVAPVAPVAGLPVGELAPASRGQARTPPDDAPAPGDVGPAPVLPEVDDAWITEVADATGIGPVALRAYARATLQAALDAPACGLGWSTLAAIGAVESGHGTHGGATLLEDGRPTVPIVGPALDGGPGVAAIPATPESFAWHGDPDWDHAVGPMQFIPSTWARWATDGDGDGVADPQDVDDAAAAAARYLCASGGDLATGEGWWAAALSYNRSEAYAAQVLATADGYAVASRTGER